MRLIFFFVILICTALAADSGNAEETLAQTHNFALGYADRLGQVYPGPFLNGKLFFLGVQVSASETLVTHTSS